MRPLTLLVLTACTANDPSDAPDGSTPPTPGSPSDTAPVDSATAPTFGPADTELGLYRVVGHPDVAPWEANEVVTLTLEVWTPDGAPVPGARLVVTPTMPSMNHGIGTTVPIVELGGGAYEAQWTFTMPGTWAVEVAIDAALGADRWIFETEVD